MWAVLPCKSFCTETSSPSQSFNREILLPQFLILSLLISFAKPLWLWMYGSIYTDWQWPSKRTSALLPLNLLGSRRLSFMPLPGGLSVLIPCNFVAGLLWCESLLLICTFFCCLLLFSPLHPLPLVNHVLQTLKTPPQRCYYLTGGSAGKLMQTHAFQDHWSKDHVSFSLQSTYPNRVTRPLLTTQKWRDHWGQRI